MLDGTIPDFFPNADRLKDTAETELTRRPIILTRRAAVHIHAKTVLIVIAIYVSINLISARFVVEGPSMEPNFTTGDFIVVNRLAYLVSVPARGDVVVFHNPEDPSHEFIKRVIGLPGEVIRIDDGTVYVNGKPLDEPYIKSICEDHRCDNIWTLDSTHYFVLGDNRNESHDGHNFGPLDHSMIIGQAWIRYWPPAAWGLIPSHDYQ